MVYVDRNSENVSYWEVPSHDNKKVWLTDEQLLIGKVRASGLENYPYVVVKIQ